MDRRYTRTAVFLHWLMAAGLMATFWLGFYMADLPLSPNKLKLYSWHKWAGISLLILIVWRLIWRLRYAAPPLPQGIGRGARRLAHLGHWALYALMVLIPISGWLMSSAQGVPVVWLGVVPLPDLVPHSPALGEFLLNTHVALNYALLCAVIGHITAALYHYFIKKDGIMQRMMPWWRHPKASTKETIKHPRQSSYQRETL